jgi:hypothetical protein
VECKMDLGDCKSVKLVTMKECSRMERLADLVNSYIKLGRSIKVSSKRTIDKASAFSLILME